MSEGNEWQSYGLKDEKLTDNAEMIFDVDSILLHSLDVVGTSDPD